jgi:phage shock protein C
MDQNTATAPSDATASAAGTPFASVDPDPSSTALPASTGIPAARFTLRRSRTDRMLGGVLGGLAASLGADVALLRVLTVALTLITGGAAAVVYVAAWVLAPADAVS